MHRIRFWMFATVVVLVPVVVWGTMLLDNVVRWGQLCSEAAQVTPGMTQAEVIAIMGQPAFRASADRLNKDTWDAFWYTAHRFAMLPAGPDSKIYVEFDPLKVRSIEAQPAQPIAFDSADWKRSTLVRRGCMVRDLVKRFDLSAMNKKQVLELLGAGDFNHHFAEWDLGYCVAQVGQGLVPSSYQWLLIKFDQQGIVSKYTLAEQ